MNDTEMQLSDERWNRLASLYGLSADDRQLVERIVSDISVSDEVERSLTFFDPTSADLKLLAAKASTCCFTLQDTHWHQIKTCSLLPDVCRAEVESIVSQIVKLRLVMRSSELASRKRLMNRAATKAERLARDIGRVQSTSGCGDCGVAEERLRRELLAYTEHLRLRMERFRPGRKHDGKLHAIEVTDRLLQKRSGRRIRLGPPDRDGFDPTALLHLLFQVAGVPVNGSLLKVLIGRYLKSRDERGGKWSWEVWFAGSQQSWLKP